MAETHNKSQIVHRTDRDGAAVIALQNPPSNALGGGLVQALSEAFEGALSDPSVTAIILTGTGRNFATSPEPSMSDARAAEALRSLCNAIEASPKTVIAALQGAALGAGLELALAAHFRVAHKSAVLGFPDVALGLMPGGGGTQRLPRLVGAGLTLEMMLGGRRLAAGHADAKRMIDGHTAGSALDAAMALLQKVRETAIAPPRTLGRTVGLSDPVGYQAQIDAYRKALGQSIDPARPEILRAVEAAILLPPDTGLALEAEAYETCLNSPSAKALRYLAQADRLAAHPEGAATVSVSQLGLAGDGVDVVALAANALDRGFAVCHFAPSPEAADLVKTALTTALDKAVETFRLGRSERRERLDRFISATDPAALAGCDVVIGCGASHSQLLTQIGPHARPGMTLVTTELFSLIQDSTLLGMSLDNEARLAEILHSSASLPDDLARLAMLMQRLGWQCVLEKADLPLSKTLKEERAALLSTLAALGARPKQIDSVAERMGLNWTLDKSAGTPSGSMPDADIRRFLRSAMAARGMAYVRNGALARASDMDVLATRALGYARASGGPMHMAQTRGLLALERDIAQFAEAAPGLIYSDPALDELIKTGQGWSAFR